MLVHVIVMCVLGNVWSSPNPNTERYRSAQTQQSAEPVMHPYMGGLEPRTIYLPPETLRKLYSGSYSSPSWELAMETQSTKLETLETKLSRIETLLDLKIEKLTENLNSKSLKEELTKDQLNRKIDTTYERLNHRINYMESRIESNIAKLQNSLDTTLSRISNQMEHFEKTTNIIENDVLEISTNMEETKLLLSSFNNSMVHNQQNDDAKNNIDLYYEKFEKIFATEIVSFTTKVSTMYNDLSQLMKKNEEMVRKSLDLVNATRRELQDGIKSIKANRRHMCPSVQDDIMDYMIELGRTLETLSRKSESHYQRLDHNIEGLHVKQAFMMENCHRLEQEEPQLVTRISEILEKIIDKIQNKTAASEKNYENLNEMLKSHHSHVIRTAGHTANTVLKLHEQMDQELKVFSSNSVCTDKMDLIVYNLQELQDQFQDVSYTNMSNQSCESYSNYLEKKLNVTDINHSLQTLTTSIDKLNTKVDELKTECQQTKDDRLKTEDGFSLFDIEEDEINDQIKSDAYFNQSKAIDRLFHIFEINTTKVNNKSNGKVLEPLLDLKSNEMESTYTASPKEDNNLDEIEDDSRENNEEKTFLDEFDFDKEIE